MTKREYLYGVIGQTIHMYPTRHAAVGKAAMLSRTTDRDVTVYTITVAYE